MSSEADQYISQANMSDQYELIADMFYLDKFCTSPDE